MMFRVTIIINCKYYIRVVLLVKKNIVQDLKLNVAQSHIVHDFLFENKKAFCFNSQKLQTCNQSPNKY